MALTVIGFLSPVAAMADGDSKPLAAKTPEEDSIDQPLISVLENFNRRIPVILFLRTQLLPAPAAYGEYCKANAAKRRSALRRSVLERLKAMAEKEQKQVLEALESPPGARRLWIVNAISVTLTPQLIRRAAGLDAVRYVYIGARNAAAARPGNVRTVLKQEERKPFSVKEKKVPWNLEMIGAARVWKELGITGEGAVVAMLDTGANYPHEDLRSNIWINRTETPNNGLDDDGNGYTDDYYGYDFSRMRAEVIARGRQQHGTWTAGIVAGDGSGGTVTGVAPRARLMLLKAGGFYATALAYQYALENGADVISMSFSIPNLGNRRALWRLMCEHATLAGLVSVSGAGNFQQQAAIPVQLRIPEGIPCVIGAGGVNRQMRVPIFCSLGPVEWGSVKFYNDYAMPGGLVKPDVCGFPGPGYPLLGPAAKGYIDPNTNIKGNSFSGPHIAGVAALMLSANPELPAWRIKEIMEATAKDLWAKGKDNRTGAGLLDAFEATREAKERSAAATTPEPAEKKNE